MSLTLDMQGLVRGTSAPGYSSGSSKTGMNRRGDQLVAQALPEHAEMTRLGVRWSTATPVANAFAPVAASPTTLANIVLYNGSSTLSLVIDTVGVWEQTSLAALSGFTLLAQISNAGVAAPTDNAALLMNSGSGKTYSGNTKKAIANTAFAVADKWEAIGSAVGAPAAGIGSGVFAEVKGRYIVPPSAALCLNVVASTAAGTLIQCVSWYEVLLDLG